MAMGAMGCLVPSGMARCQDGRVACTRNINTELRHRLVRCTFPGELTEKLLFVALKMVRRCMAAFSGSGPENLQ